MTLRVVRTLRARRAHLVEIITTARDLEMQRTRFPDDFHHGTNDLLAAVMKTTTRATMVWSFVVTGISKAERKYCAKMIAFEAFILSFSLSVFEWPLARNSSHSRRQDHDCSIHNRHEKPGIRVCLF